MVMIEKQPNPSVALLGQMRLDKRPPKVVVSREAISLEESSMGWLKKRNFQPVLVNRETILEAVGLEKPHYLVSDGSQSVAEVNAASGRTRLIVVSSDISKETSLLNSGAEFIRAPIKPRMIAASLFDMDRQRPPTFLPPVILGEDIKIDYAKLQVTKNGTPKYLDLGEFLILTLLAKKTEAGVSLDELMNLFGWVEKKAARVYISRLRDKLDNPNTFWKESFIETVRNEGFRLREPRIKVLEDK